MVSTETKQLHSIPGDLYSYQQEDLDRLLSTDTSQMILSEMGTGKTPIAIGLGSSGNYGKVLIVCPKTLQLEWLRQIEEWTGQSPSIARRGCYRRLEPLFDDILGIKDTPFFILNYESFRTRRHLDILNVYPFDLVILDEAHKLRNPRTKQTKGMYEFLLTNHPKTRVIPMTGSPIVNNPADLFTLLCLVKPEDFKLNHRMQFIDRWCHWRRTKYGIKVTGVRDMEGLRRRTADFTIRRTKKEVLPFLPDKYFRRVLLEMDDDQREVYKSMEKDLFVMLDEEGQQLYASSVLAQLMRLRQINLDPILLGKNVSSSKTDFLKELFEEIEGDNRKLVVFSCFESYIDYLDKIIPIPHVVITGKVPANERARNVVRFQNDPNIPLVFGTIQTMGEGITLTAASDVVLVDRWWNPMANNQAIDRLHRISQKNAVQVILPINERSIDKSLDRILAAKESLASAYLGDTTMIQETIEDLRYENLREKGQTL